MSSNKARSPLRYFRVFLHVLVIVCSASSTPSRRSGVTLDWSCAYPRRPSLVLSRKAVCDTGSRTSHHPLALLIIYLTSTTSPDSILPLLQHSHSTSKSTFDSNCKSPCHHFKFPSKPDMPHQSHQTDLCNELQTTVRVSFR